MKKTKKDALGASSVGTTTPATHSSPPGGTARGWTFWETASSCWRRWFYRYVLTMLPFIEPEYFALGSIYHALHEGITEAEIASWGENWQKLLPEGKRLYEARLRGPPLPNATAVEQTLEVPGLPMTSKPDREEKTFGGRPMPRDFKTSGWFGEHDDKFWAVNGQIIGQMLATASERAQLDLIHKRTGETRLLEVQMTPEKKDALVAMIGDLDAQLRLRMADLHENLNAATATGAVRPITLVNHHFPPRLSSCVTKYGPCPYYARCWSKGEAPEKYMYKETGKRDWLSVGATKEFAAQVKKVAKLAKGAL